MNDAESKTVLDTVGSSGFGPWGVGIGVGVGCGVGVGDGVGVGVGVGFATVNVSLTVVEFPARSATVTCRLCWDVLSGAFAGTWKLAEELVTWNCAVISALSSRAWNVGIDIP